MSERWVYRANRSFGVMNQDEHVTFDKDDDPVMISLVGAGYLDLVSGPPEPKKKETGIPSKAKLGTPSINVE